MTDDRMLRDDSETLPPKKRRRKRPEGAADAPGASGHAGIACPRCGDENAHYVYSTRPYRGGRRRFRACRRCGKYFTTDERAAT